MICADRQFYNFKYVNGHAGSTAKGKLCVAALGMLAQVEDGYPLLLCEMTLLAARRTVTTAALSLVYDLATAYSLGRSIDMLLSLTDPKDL